MEAIEVKIMWVAVWKVLAQVFTSGESLAGRKAAEEELGKMARAADAYNELINGHTIVVEFRDDDWIAWLKGQPNIMGTGFSPEAAVGSLMLTFPEHLGIKFQQ